jgi:anti-sigma factor RsiW
MTSHLSGERIERYLARTLSPADVLSFHDHIEACAECRHAVEETTLARAMPAAVPLLWDTADTRRSPHLSEDEMVALVAGRLPEPRRAEAAGHVAECEICRDSVAAMESERPQPAATPIRRRGSGWVALAIAAALLIGVLVHYRAGHPSAPAPPAVLASVRDAGQTIELDANGALRGLEGASPEERNLVRDTLRQGALPSGTGLAAQAPGVLLAPDTGAPAPFSLIGPIDTRVLSDRPIFTWHPHPGATAYQVLVTSESLDPLARSERITATEWQPAAALPRGVVLLWQVRAWLGGEMVSAPAPPAPPARFAIAGEAIAARLAQLRKSPRPSHLLAAVLCAREGLRDEAAQEVQALVRENPGSPLIWKLAAGQPAR